MSSSSPKNRHTAADQELSAADRMRAWLVTGPLARFVAFVIDFSAALIRGFGEWRRRHS